MNIDKNPTINIHEGDCLEVMRGMADNSVDSIVTDPPYGLSFMGKKWDYDVPSVEIWREALRVLKPGGYLLAFGGTRTYHRLVVNIEDAGFEIRDQIAWVYGSGFPKSQNVSKAIDKTLGAEREKTGGTRPRLGFTKLKATMGLQTVTEFAETSEEPVSDGAAQWQGWGTALKPAMEPVVVARKPLIGTVATNVLEHGTGGLNIDACRVPCNDKTPFPVGANSVDAHGVSHGKTRVATDDSNKGGRWPANLIHDGSPEATADFPINGAKKAGSRGAYKHFDGEHNPEGIDIPRGYDDPGGSTSRYFYHAKASKADRADSKHPTVKPVALMRYLCRLVTPPGGTVLDPFGGSGTTGRAALDEGFNAILIEREAEYAADIRKRFKPAGGKPVKIDLNPVKFHHREFDTFRWAA